jgi:hypothetical protein
MCSFLSSPPVVRFLSLPLHFLPTLGGRGDEKCFVYAFRSTLFSLSTGAKPGPFSVVSRPRREISVKILFLCFMHSLIIQQIILWLTPMAISAGFATGYRSKSWWRRVTSGQQDAGSSLDQADSDDQYTRPPQKLSSPPPFFVGSVVHHPAMLMTLVASASAFPFSLVTPGGGGCCSR